MWHKWDYDKTQLYFTGALPGDKNNLYIHTTFL